MAVLKYVGQDCYIEQSKKAQLVSIDRKKAVPVTSSEVKILSFFIDNKNKPVSLEDIAAALWGQDYAADPDFKDPESIKSQISRIRGKLNKINDDLGACIKTNHGYGTYTMVIEDDSSDSDQSSEDTVTTAHYTDLKKLGYTPLSIAEALVKNDMALYGPESVYFGRSISPENEGSPPQWAEYLSSYPDSFQYLINSKGEIIGNFSFLSLKEHQAEAYVKGLLFENSFSPAETRDMFSAGNDHILFLLNMSVNDDYASPGNLRMLRRLFLEELVALAQENILFCKIITNVFKSNQEAFYREWGFRFIQDHPLSGRMYELQLMPYPQKLYEHLNQTPEFIEANEKLRKYYGQ